MRIHKKIHIERTENNHKQEKPDYIVSLAILFLLIVGSIISLAQSRRLQNTRTRAQTTASAQSDCTVSESQLTTSPQEQQLYDEINKYRQENNLPALILDPQLKKASAWMSNDMLTHQSLSHTDSLGRGILTRLSDCGTVFPAEVGENIDSGVADASTTISAWKHSNQQSENILNPDFTKVGVSLATGSDSSQAYWTVDFSGPAPAPTSSPSATPTPSLLTPPLTKSPTPTIKITPTPTIHVNPKATPTPTTNPNGSRLVCDPTTITLASFAQKISVTLSQANGVKISKGVITWSADNTSVVFANPSTTTDNQGTSGNTVSVPHATNSAFSSTITARFVGDGLNPASTCTIHTTFNPSVTPPPTPLPTKPYTPSNTPVPTITPTPTTDPSFVQNPYDTQVFVSVKYPGIGIGGNLSPVHLARKIQVTIFDLDNQKVVDGFGYIKYDHGFFRGIIHMGNITNGTYYVKILGENTLTTLVLPEFQQFSNAKLNILPTVTLVPGDLNADNIIDITDFDTALTCFQDKKCVTKDLIDFNDDGKVNATDYNIFLQSFWTFEGD